FFCIDSDRVTNRVLLDEGKLKQIEGDGSIELHGEHLPRLRLRKLLAQTDVVDPKGPCGLIVWQAADHRAVLAGRRDRFALVVDAITGQQETLVRSLGRHAARWRGVSGAAELWDGKVALVLDLEQLIEAQVTPKR
ncbi:MAG TPA: chemotaxis protein CheW, partial [Pyrinomonadaceae bacterium]|nr:chemotaxis protein CheW [Pyrinomonadaceae bacterium]